MLVLFLSVCRLKILKNSFAGISIDRKGLARGFVYLLLFSFFIIYTTYFSQFIQFIFAATPTPSPPTLTDSPDPQKGGSSVTFQFTCSDTGNNVEGYVCKASDCANCLSGDTSNCWCASGAVAADPSCTYSCPAGSTSTNNYYGQCRSSAGEYTAATAAATFTCDGIAPRFTNNITNVSSPATYSKFLALMFNATWTDDTALNQIIFEFNGANTTPSSQVSVYYNNTMKDLAAGSYNFRWFAQDTAGNWNNTTTSPIPFTISKGTPVLTFTLDGSTSSPQQKTYSGNSQTSSLVTTCGFPANDATYPTCTLFRNDVSIGTGNVTATTAEGNSTIRYNYTSAANANWTASSLNRTLVVLKGIPVLNLTLNVSSPITYGTASRATGGNCTMTGGTDVTCTLYRGNYTTTNASTPNSVGTRIDDAILGVGTVAYNFSSNTGANWTSASATNMTLIITPASQGTSFSVSPGSTVTYPTETTASCARTSGDSASTIYIYRNGTLKASGTTPQSEIATLPAGTYNYTCVIGATTNYSQVTSVNNIVTVSQSGSMTLTIFLTPSAFVAYGTSTTAQGNGCPTTGADDVTCKLYRNNSLVATYPTVSFETITLGAGNYSYIYNSTGGQNYTSATSSASTLSVNKIAPSISVSLSPSSSVNYPTQTTASCSRVAGDSGSLLTLYRNGTQVASGTSSPQSEIITLPYGGYNYTCTINATQNYTAASSVNNNLIVSRTNADVIISPYTQSITYGTSVLQYCSSKNATVCNLFRNSVNITSQNNTNIVLAAATYNYVANISDTSNYTNAQNSSTLTVNRATPSLSVGLSPSSTVTYPTETTASCSRVSGDSSSTLTLFRNGTQVASGTSSPQSEISTLAVGLYNYSCTISLTENYTAATSVNNNLNVTAATQSLSVSFSPGSTTTYPTSTTASCSRVSGDPTSTLTLFRNGTQMASGTSSPQSETKRLGAGNYNYTCIASATANYSAASTLNNNLAISQNTSAANFMNLTINGTEGNKSYSFPAGTNATAWYNSNAFIDSSFSFTLYRNSTTIGSTNPISDVINPSAGAYNYTYFTSGNANYSSARKNYFVTVGQIAPSISVSLSPSSSVVYPTQTTAQCARVAGDSTSTLTLFRNGTQVASGTSSPQYETTTLGVGTYNYSCAISATENYTASSSLNNNLVVARGTTQIRMFLNGTEADKTYSSNGWANITATLNVTGKTVYITSNMPGFGTQSGTTPFTYIKKLTNEGTFNITAYFLGDSNYTSSVQTYFATVSASCIVKGNAFYAETGNPIASGTVTYIIKETGDTDYSTITNGYFEMPCAFPNVPGKRVTVGIIVNSSDNKLGYVQLVAGGGSSTTQTQECSTKQWYFNGTAADISTGRYISQGNASVSVMGMTYINTTHFSNGKWSIQLSPCLISGQLYTFQIAVSGENKLSVAFVNQVAK